MASKVIRRSKSDPNYLARQKVASVADGRLFMKRGDSDEECLIGREQGRFRKKNRPKDGVKRGLRISKAYMLNEDSSAAATDRPTDKPSRIQDFNRRHTVGGSLTTVHEEVPEEREDQEKKWKRDVLIGYLENKYKDYYHSTGNMDQYVEQAGINGYAETDLDDTMSEIDTAPTSGFKRGGHARASLPVVRHGLNKSKDKPLGLIYLQYMNETKRALMPNEVTGMDTVRALFVRSFKGQLNMDMLDLPARKIYIRDPLTEIFYELENPHEIKDRTVLKIYEPGFQESTDAGIIRSSASTPVDTSYLLEPEVDQQVRQRRYHTMTMPVVKEREGRERTKSEGAVYSKQTAQNEGAPDRRVAGAQEQRQPLPHQQHPRPQQQHPPPSQNQPQYFQRGAPERATVGGTIPHRPSQNQAPFRRGTPSRASATIPRGDPRGGMGLPSNQQGYRPQERRDWKAPMQGQNRIGGPGGTKGPINSGAKTLPPGASLEGPREPHPQRMGVPRGGPPQGVPPAMHGPPDDGRRSTQSLQGPRASPSPQSYSTSPRRVPPQQNGTIQVTGHKSQPDLRTTHNSSPSAIHQAKGTQDDTSKRIASMEAQIANLAGMVRTAIHHGGGSQSTGGSPVRTNPQMNNGPAQPPHLQRGPNQRQQPGPGHPSHGWGKRGPGSSPMHGRGGYHSAQNSPLMIRQQNNPPPTQQNQQQDNQPETQDGSPKLNLIPARVEFIPPTGEPTTPNLGYIKTTDDSKTTNQPDWQPTNQSGSQTLPQTPTKRSGAPMQSRSSFDQHIRKLRDEQKNIRNMHLHMVKHMNESFQSTSNRIRQALDSRAGVHDPQPIKYQGYHIRQEVARYNHKKDAISNELRQLETRVEKLRVSTVNSRSQVDTRSVDNLAQLLGNSSRLIAEQKATFPLLAGKLKSIMEGEMEVVVVEEKFLKNEPGSLDEYVKRCKKLTGTLYTLKRLAEVQEIQGSKSDLTSELQMSIRNQSPLQQSPAPSPIMSKTPKQTTQTNVQDPSQAPPMKKWFASPAQRSRFEQSLRDCKKNLRTTLFAQNAAMRQKRHITALYQQDQHDTMTPIITPDKEARKSLTKKKGPPPPPPPRRSSSNKASPIKQDRQAMQTSIMGRQEILIQGKSNLRNVDEKHGNSIDQALDDLESFALKAGDLDAFSKTGSHRILVESPPARTNRTVHSEAPVMISQSQEPVRERSLSDGDITLDAALNKLISNNNVGETQVPRSPETKSPSRSNKMLESIKQDLKGDEDADFETTRAKEIIQSEEVLSERVVIKEHPEAKGSTWASSSNKNNNSKGQPKIEVGSVLEGRNLSLAGGDQVKKVCPQQITIISPRGKIEETFIF